MAQDTKKPATVGDDAKARRNAKARSPKNVPAVVTDVPADISEATAVVMTISPELSEAMASVPEGPGYGARLAEALEEPVTPKRTRKPKPAAEEPVAPPAEDTAPVVTEETAKVEAAITDLLDGIVVPEDTPEDTAPEPVELGSPTPNYDEAMEAGGTIFADYGPTNGTFPVPASVTDPVLVAIQEDHRLAEAGAKAALTAHSEMVRKAARRSKKRPHLKEQYDGYVETRRVAAELAVTRLEEVTAILDRVRADRSDRVRLAWSSIAAATIGELQGLTIDGPEAKNGYLVYSLADAPEVGDLIRLVFDGRGGWEVGYVLDADQWSFGSVVRIYGPSSVADFSSAGTFTETWDPPYVSWGSWSGNRSPEMARRLLFVMELANRVATAEATVLGLPLSSSRDGQG